MGSLQLLMHFIHSCCFCLYKCHMWLCMCATYLSIQTPCASTTTQLNLSYTYPKTKPLPALMYTWWTCCCCLFFIREYCFFNAEMSMFIRSIIILLNAAWYSLRQASIAPGLSSAMLLEPRLCSSLGSIQNGKGGAMHKNVIQTNNGLR